MTATEIRLLGRIEVARDGDPMPIPSIKARAIVALTALSDRGSVSRETLSMMLWPDIPSARSRGSLRQTLKRLRDTVNAQEDFIDFGRDHISFKTRNAGIDSEEVLENLSRGDAPQPPPGEGGLTAAYLSELDGLTVELDGWIAVQRRFFHDKVSAALEQVALDDQIDTENRIRAAQNLISIDPTHEVAYRCLIKLHSSTGNPGAAIRLYEELYRILDEDYELEPSPETVELIAKVKMGEIGGVAEPAPAVASAPTIPVLDTNLERPVIRVQPFATEGQDSPSGIARAFTRDLISVLVRFREWVVMDGAPDDSADESYVLEGIEQTGVGGEPLVSVILKSNRTRQFLWSETLSARHDAWERSQLQVMQRFASAIDVSISRHRLSVIQRLVPSSRPVFDRWLYCQNLIGSWKPENGAEVIRLLDEITQVEPGFAPARAELAATYTSYHLIFPGELPEASRISSAMRLGRTAVDIDPLDTRAQRALAWAHLMSGEFELAELHFGNALNLNASNAFTSMSSALGFAFCGAHDRAKELCDKARQIQPTLPGFLQGYIGVIDYLAGRYEDCVSACRKADTHISNLPGWEAAALQRLGDAKAASEAADRFSTILQPIWCGNQPAEPESIADWFSVSFPIREAATREQLNKDLRTALLLDRGHIH